MNFWIKQAYKLYKDEDFKNLLYSMLEIQVLTVKLAASCYWFLCCDEKILTYKHFSLMKPTKIPS